MQLAPILLLPVLLANVHPTTRTIAHPPAANVVAYDNALTLLESGKQSEAEKILPVYMAEFMNDQKIAFFFALCTRSRFEIQDADPIFQDVVQMNPSTPEGICASCALSLDRDTPDSGAILTLDKIAKKYRDNPLPVWLEAIECRQLERDYWGSKNYLECAQFGIACYGEMMRRIHNKPGPVLVHQTWGNFYEDIGQYRDALAQHAIAVQQEPAEWDCSALLTDLDALGMKKEAADFSAEFAAYLSSGSN